MDEKNRLKVQTSSNAPEASIPKKRTTAKKWMASKRGKNVVTAGCFAVALFLIFLGSSIRNEHIRTAYEKARDAEEKTAYDKIYQTAYEYAEEKHHVSNRATISIGDVSKLSRLEVLRVSDSEFVIENAKDNDQNITSWLEVQGIGVFTVDLEAAEFIRDDVRQYVLVRVWKPELTNCTIDEVGKCLWRNDWRNDSVKEGVRLTLQQIGAGQQCIEKNIRQNRNFYDSAKDTAKRSIASLVKSWNPQIPDLTVEVEFVD